MVKDLQNRDVFVTMWIRVDVQVFFVCQGKLIERDVNLPYTMIRMRTFFTYVGQFIKKKIYLVP